MPHTSARASTVCTAQELITAVRLNLNLVVLLINDNCAWPRPCRSSASTVVA
jgi:hypothetical protein